MPPYHGYRGRLYLSTSAGGTAIPVASITGWSMDFPTDKADVVAFGDRHSYKKRGMQDPKGSVDGLFDDDTLATVKGAADSADGAKFYLYPTLASPARYFYGTAWVDPSFTGAVKGAAVGMKLALEPADDNWDYKEA